MKKIIHISLASKVNGGILYLVLCCSLVISMTLAMIILLRYYYSAVDRHNDVILKLIRNVESGWEYARANDSTWSPEHNTIDLFGRESDTVVIHSIPWGAYRAVAIEAKHFGKTEKQSGLLGKSAPEAHRYAIRLINRVGSKLKVMENTVIKGDVMVPSSTVLPTFYNGEPFENDKVVDGQIFDAAFQLPPIDDHWLAYVNNLLHNTSESYTEDIDTLSSRSYFSPTRMIASEELLEISSSFRGNIVFYSSVAILVQSNAKLDGVLLVAPTISIADSVKGNFQAIASTKLTLGQGAHLTYPSSLIIVEQDVAGSMNIGKSRVEGSIIMISHSGIKPELIVTEHAHIIGEIYVQGKVQLYGNVTGSVVCEAFVFAKGGEVRDNALRNVTINRGGLPRYFVLSAIYAETSSTDIACWL